MIELRSYVEAAIDFPEEEIDFLADRELAERFQTVRDHFEGVLDCARQGRLLREGMTVVIAGRPNAGKSSLLNRLAGYDAAIVTPIPGTTRDIVRERIAIDGMPLHVLDTAGLRDAGDLVEEEGIRRAHAEIARADRVLFVIDAVADPTAGAYREERARLPADVPVTLVFNKCDLAVGLPVADTLTGPPVISLSALEGTGLEELRAHLKQCMGYQTRGGGCGECAAAPPGGAGARPPPHRGSRAPAHRDARRGTRCRGAAGRAAGPQRDHRGVHHRGSARPHFRRVLHRQMTVRYRHPR